MNKKIVTFGEIMLRLTPPNYGIIEDAHDFMATYGGTEANVAISLAQFGHYTSFVSKLPKNQLGEAAIKFLNANKVDTNFVQMKGDNIGIYFLETGFGIRPSKVLYNRKSSAMTTLKVEDINIDALIKDAGWFHFSGITLSLSEDVRKTVLAVIKKAKQNGVFISFDSNYRKSLWPIEIAKKAYMEVAPYIDLFFATPFDAHNLFGIDETYEGSYALKQLLEKTNATYVFGYERNVYQANENELKAYVVKKDLVLQTKPIRFQIYDRIGGGDAFAAGIIHSLIKTEHDNLEFVLDFGLSTSVLKHTLWGDAFKLSELDVLNFMKNQSKEVVR
ncbi:sugar kinase [Acholeplasma granularum]|uniref:sugar kinase n=1 Tax=Acholeplasma granularum TaxID=264635 RepID=UPI00046E9609|nr:sugar kinase [Acholeplasma granularum]